MSKQIIYHGSYCKVDKPKVMKGKYAKDFGTREAFWELAKFRHPTHQIAFCTEQSLKCIKFIEAKEK